MNVNVTGCAGPLLPLLPLPGCCSLFPALFKLARSAELFRLRLRLVGVGCIFGDQVRMDVMCGASLLSAASSEFQANPEA